MIFSKSFNTLYRLFTWLLTLPVLCSCSLIPFYRSGRETTPSARKEEPRVVASLQLTDQGRMLLEEGNADAAIRVLERAISLDPQSGESYYYFAEAWLAKTNYSQAVECNRLADMYLRGQSDWMERIADQQMRIEQLER